MKSNDLKYIYLACPWSPIGGGMYKVADYLIQFQAVGMGSADLRVLDTRGGGRAILSLPILVLALVKVLLGRLSGRLVGVHINMAERLSFFRKGTLVLFARLIGLPVVVHLHAAQLHHGYHALPPILQQLMRWVFSKASFVIVLGRQAQKFAIEDLGVPASQVEILINGVPANSEPRRKVNTGGPFNILFLGNLTERKGVSDLLKAIALPELIARKGRWHLRVAGGGDIAYYQTLAKSLNIADCVDFLGWADQKTAAHLLAQADTVILPSYDEGLPLSILEALATGVAVVATPVGEIPSVLTSGINTLFVNPGDIPAIAKTLCRLMDEPSLREKLEQAGFEIYKQQFSMDVFFRNVARIHQQQFGYCASLLG